MPRWADLVLARPDLADAGTRLLYYHAVGLGYLATIRKDGGARALHAAYAARGSWPPTYTTWRA